MDRTIGKDKLRTTLVHRLEALAGLAILPVRTAIGTCITTFPQPDDGVINGSTGTGPERVEVHPTIAMLVALGRNDFAHGDHLARAIGDVTEASTPVTT